jgi:flagellar basal body rod protein FlgF
MSGKRIYSKNTGAQTITIPTNATIAFAIDDTLIAIVNNGTTAITIAPAGGVTLNRAGTTQTGNRTLAAKGIALLQPVENDVWFVDGSGLS